MSTAKWMGIVAAVATLAGTGTASAAAPGPEAVARAYVAALRAHDVHRLCALQDVRSVPQDGFTCLGQMREESVLLVRARVGAAFRKGSRARVVVDVVRNEESASYDAVRSRMLLRRHAGRWLVADSGQLPGLFPADDPSADPRPAGRAAALRRLADDELLALSGAGTMMCALLAPGAPLGGRGGCHTIGPAPTVVARRLARFAVVPTDATHARLSATVAVDRAVATHGRPGWALRTATHRDTLFAVKVRSGWRLVKPSREFYRVVGAPAPTDVGSPAPTATWPMADAAPPSISERPVPAGCRTPPVLWDAGECRPIGGLAVSPRPAGGGVIAWTDGPVTRTRAVGAGTALAPATVATPLDDDGLWTVIGLPSVAGGSLLVQNSADTLGVQVTPLDADGHPRAAPVPVFKGYENSDDGGDSVVAVGPPGARIVGVIVERSVVKRLGPDGTVVAPDVPVRSDQGTIVIEPDGSLLAVSGEDDGGVGVRRLGADGHPVGVTISQHSLPEAVASGPSPAVAEDAEGRLLIVWREDDDSGHGLLRAWRYDPAAPTTGTPVPVARVSVTRAGFDSYDPPETIAVGALPGGGWGVAYTLLTGKARPVWATRLDASGAPVTAPRLVAPTATSADYGDGALGIAGDNAVWIAPPAVAVLPQVRAAPLP